MNLNAMPGGERNAFSSASDFDHLYDLLDKSGGLHGTQSFYSAAELKSLIDSVRSGIREISYIPRTSGLRDTVRSLLQRKESPSMPRVGDHVRLIKRSIVQGEASEVRVGQELRGTLRSEITVGAQIRLSDGQTSDVRSIRHEGGRTLIDTETSTYEMLRDSEGFSGLNIKNELGSVELPASARSARPQEDAYDQTFGDVRLKVDAKALSNVLLEVDGVQIFKAVNRYMVVAKVRNIHLPFYISSKGTDSKNAGEWYPFFGYTGDWLVKGSIGEKGEMLYHPEIKKVQDLLNKNLILDQRAVNRYGKALTKTGQTIFDLNNYLKYYNFANSDEWLKSTDAEMNEMRFIQKMTGYYPTGVKYAGEGGTSAKWIDAIVKSIR